MLNTSAERGALGATPGLVITVWVSRAAQQGQVRSFHRSAAAMRASQRPRHGGVSVCRVADGRAGGCGGRLSPGAGCMRCNESGWLPGQARDVANDAEARRVPRSCGAGRAALTGTADDAPDATGCTRMHRDASRRNDDARRATASAASSLHQIQAAREVPGHRSRTALGQAEGAATPHAAPQVARVHANRRMMQPMQLRSLSALFPACGATGAG